MVAPDRFLQSFLNVPAEMAGIGVINAAIHEAKAVGGTHDGVALNVKD